MRKCKHFLNLRFVVLSKVRSNDIKTPDYGLTNKVNKEYYTAESKELSLPVSRNLLKINSFF